MFSLLVPLTLCLLLSATLSLSWNPSPACGASYWDDHQNRYEGIDRMEGSTGVSLVNIVVYSNPWVVWCAAPDRNDSDHLVAAVDYCYLPLISYFNGSNDRQQHLNLTIPLISHVLRYGVTDTTWRYQVGFKLPYELGSNIPLPTDAGLSIDVLGFDRWTAVGLRFGGKTLTDNTVATALQQLNQTVQQQLGISRVSEWHKALEVYDPKHLDTDYNWNQVIHFLPLGEQESAVGMNARNVEAE